MKTKIKLEPVVAGDIIKIVAWLVGLLVSAGVLAAGDGDQVNNYAAILAPAAALLVNLVVAWWQRSQVTPLAAPTDNDGNPLRVDEVAVP